MLKFLGATAVVTSSVLVGMALIKGLKQRTREMEALLSMLIYIETEIRYTGRDLLEILAHLCRREDCEPLKMLPVCESLCRAGISFPQAWRQSLEETADSMQLRAPDIELVLGFGEQLGATDMQGQMDHCAQYRELINRQLAHVKAEEQTKSRLYRSLSLMAGIAIAIVLI